MAQDEVDPSLDSGRLKMGPLWDMDLGFANVGDGNNDEQVSARTRYLGMANGMSIARVWARRGGHFEYRHAHTRAIDMPSGCRDKKNGVRVTCPALAEAG